MPLETGSFINDLTPSNPPNSDPAGQGDDHLRLIKATVQGTFPQMGTVFTQVRRQDTALSISSIWNTNHFLCSASATATVVLTLPPASSITAGFYVDITTVGTGTVSLLPSGAASINGGVSLSIPRLNTARALFTGGTAWQASVIPHGDGGSVFGGNVTVDGTLSVSGATTLGALTVNGVVTLSAAVHMKSTLSISGAVTLAGALTVSGATTLAGLTVQGTATISGTVVLSIGQVKFPGTAVPSTDVNTLDDYEEGTWTPAITFTTPGNLVITYSTQTGAYTKIGNLVQISLRITTVTFTHTTASGTMLITGLPFTPAGVDAVAISKINGLFNAGGAGFDMAMAHVTSSPSNCIIMSLWDAAGGGYGDMSPANHPTGNVTVLEMSGSYRV